MQKITVLAVGSLKAAWADAACRDYVTRLGHDLKFSVVELPASKQSDAIKQAAEEEQALLRWLSDVTGQIWVLDERGREYTSVSWADELTALADRGEELTLVLGGAYGFGEELRSRADRIVRLSAMTLPHELARVFLLEQLYRAVQIRKGTGYHHD